MRSFAKFKTIITDCAVMSGRWRLVHYQDEAARKILDDFDRIKQCSISVRRDSDCVASNGLA